jgi:uncharacterized protein (TIGR04222 family)
MVTDFSAMTGMEFLVFYAALMAAAVVGGIWLPHFVRGEGREQQVTDADQLAYLAGGPARFTEMVLARLLGSGILADASDNKLRILRPNGGESPAERALTAGGGTVGITAAFKTTKPYAELLDAELRERELLMERSSRWIMRLIATLPYLFVLLVGFYRRSAGEALGEPTGFLTMMMMVTGALAVWRFAKLDPRTRAGQAAVEAAKDQSARLKSAPTEPELGLGVALFGTAILAGTPYSQLHAMKKAASTGVDGGYASDSGGGDSGCGGGGCGGGCGGCGG